MASLFTANSSDNQSISSGRFALFFIDQMSEQPTDNLTPAERAAKEEQEKLEKKKEQEEQAQLPYR